MDACAFCFLCFFFQQLYSASVIDFSSSFGYIVFNVKPLYPTSPDFFAPRLTSLARNVSFFFDPLTDLCQVLVSRAGLFPPPASLVKLFPGDPTDLDHPCTARH